MWENWNRWYDWETINEAHWEASGLIIGNIQHEYFSFQCAAFHAVTPGTIIFIHTRRKWVEHNENLRFSLDLPGNRGQNNNCSEHWWEERSPHGIPTQLSTHSRSQGLARVRTGESNPNSNWQFPERNLWLRLSMNMTGRRQLAGIPLPRTPFFPVLPPGTLLCFHSTWKIWQKSTYDPCRIREM